MCVGLQAELVTAELAQGPFPHDKTTEGFLSGSAMECSL